MSDAIDLPPELKQMWERIQQQQAQFQASVQGFALGKGLDLQDYQLRDGQLVPREEGEGE